MSYKKLSDLRAGDRFHLIYDAEPGDPPPVVHTVLLGIDENLCPGIKYYGSDRLIPVLCKNYVIGIRCDTVVEAIA